MASRTSSLILHLSRNAASRRGLVNALGQVNAGMNDSVPGLSALGLCWCAGGSGRGSAALGHENAPSGLPRPDGGHSIAPRPNSHRGASG
jgi:hypothetical protein